nr:MAG TPA: hypothetical protein [Caudoviricetes sp.]
MCSVEWQRRCDVVLCAATAWHRQTRQCGGLG